MSRPIDVAPRLQRALALQQQGKLDAAEEIYQGILAQAPGNADAWHFRGLIACRRGQLELAVEMIERAIALAPDYADAHNNLGNVFAVTKRPEQALTAYQRAVELRPESVDFHLNIGRVCGAKEQGVVALRRVLELVPGHLEAHQRLGGALYCTGRIAEAAEVYARWVALEPDNEEARHLLAGCTQIAVPGRASDAYLQDYFDDFARSFDETLTEKLMYRAPALVGEGLRRTIGEPTGDRDMLDAGCGTGLGGVELRPWARRMVGVDLSAEMLKRAAARDLYDELVQEELTAFLRSRPGAWDVVAATDTLVYFGDLAPVLAAAAAALRPGGHLVFTIERTAETPAGYRLNPHGRYSHTGPYLQAQLATAGLVQLLLIEVHLRVELKQPVDGWLVVARR
jgi:predicted TPR repeat methyltransferase